MRRIQYTYTIKDKYGNLISESCLIIINPSYTSVSYHPTLPDQVCDRIQQRSISLLTAVVWYVQHLQELSRWLAELIIKPDEMSWCSEFILRFIEDPDKLFSNSCTLESFQLFELIHIG